jgi:hypothetical protein
MDDVGGGKPRPYDGKQINNYVVARFILAFSKIKG